MHAHPFPINTYIHIYMHARKHAHTHYTRPAKAHAI